MNPLLTRTSSPGAGLVWLLLLVTLGALIGQLAAYGLCLVSMGSTQISGVDTASLPVWWLLTQQAFIASGAFILAPACYLHFFARGGLGSLFQWRKNYTYPILLTLGLASTVTMANTQIVRWNMTLPIPSWLETVVLWVQEKETTLQEITALCTTFHSWAELWTGILIMGIIPAVGEELLFRGLLQNLLHSLTQSIHLAISVNAFMFSAMHLQLYGFLPRLLFGVLLGYIYWWTKDLLFPIAAHLFNNISLLVMLFLHQQNMIAHDIRTTAVSPYSTLILLIFAVPLLANRLRRHGQRLHKTSRHTTHSI